MSKMKACCVVGYCGGGGSGDESEMNENLD